MATDIIDWAPEILPWITGVPMPAIELAVRNAAIDFCKNTLLWTTTLDRITVEEDTADYTLELDTDLYAEIIGTDNVKYKQDGQDDDQFINLFPMSEVQMDMDTYVSGSWKFWTSPTPTHHWMDITTKTLHLYRIPEDESTEGLLVMLNIKPNDTTTTLPDFLMRDWRQVIGFGALGDLFQRKATPWYDKSAGVDYETKFNNKCNEALNLKVSGATKRPMGVRMRNFV